MMIKFILLCYIIVLTIGCIPVLVGKMKWFGLVLMFFVLQNNNKGGLGGSPPLLLFYV